MITKQTPPEPDALDRHPWAARNRKIVALTVVAAIVVGVAIAIMAIPPDAKEGAAPSSAPSTPSFVPIPFASHSYLDIATGDRTPVEADMTGANLPEVSPNGESVVWFTFEDGMHASALDGSGEVAVSPDGLTGYAPTWIDDETILFQGRSTGAGDNDVGDLYALNVSTGEVTMVTDLPTVKHGVWFIVSDVSPDGSTVLFHLPREKGDGSGHDLWTAPMVGGEATLLREDAAYGQYGPDGSIVFLDHPVWLESDAIWIMDGDGRHARPLVQGGHFAIPPRFSPDATTVAYGNDEVLEIVDVASGEVTALDASTHEEDPAWYDDDTLIVE